VSADNVAGLILAGGKARRLGGGDKPLLRLRDVTILERLLSVMRRGARNCAINANGDAARFAAFGLPVLADGRFEGEGPLAGVLVGLDWASEMGATTLLTVPGDTPFIPSGLAAVLAPAPACAASNGRLHYLVALWPVTLRETLRKFLSASHRRDVAYFARQVGTRHVEFPVTKWDPFLNINTPEELALARAIVEGEG
jgi:molybdopterin-guanine dinucleotide biosynthesis protein A